MQEEGQELDEDLPPLTPDNGSGSGSAETSIESSPAPEYDMIDAFADAAVSDYPPTEPFIAEPDAAEQDGGPSAPGGHLAKVFTPPPQDMDADLTDTYIPAPLAPLPKAAPRATSRRPDVAPTCASTARRGAVLEHPTFTPLVEEPRPRPQPKLVPARWTDDECESEEEEVDELAGDSDGECAPACNLKAPAKAATPRGKGTPRGKKGANGGVWKGKGRAVEVPRPWKGKGRALEVPYSAPPVPGEWASYTYPAPAPPPASVSASAPGSASAAYYPGQYSASSSRYLF